MRRARLAVERFMVEVRYPDGRIVRSPEPGRSVQGPESEFGEWPSRSHSNRAASFGVRTSSRELSEERVGSTLVVAQEPELRDLAVPEVTDEGVVRVQGFGPALVVGPLEADAMLVIR